MSIVIENVDVYGFETALRGMRNPMNSWDMSDSEVCCLAYANCSEYDKKCRNCPRKGEWAYAKDIVCIGEEDLRLARTLSKAGPDHGKFLRMIGVSLDITAPLYWWKEFDTYKVGTVANSCSTMHKIHAKEFKKEDFSFEHLDILKLGKEESFDFKSWEDDIVWMLNHARQYYLAAKEANDNELMKKAWWQMIQLLPTSYNQKRTVALNYAVLKNIYHARINHKLDEWHVLCDWIRTLPYAELIIEK